MNNENGLIDHITFIKIPDSLGDLLAGIAFEKDEPVRPITLGEIFDKVEGK